VVATTLVEEAFKDIDYAILVGAFPRRQGMERKDLLEKNCAIFKEQGAALDRFAKPTVKVLVVGNPANTNALIAMSCAPSLPRSSFSALTRLDHNRAKAQIALRLKVPVQTVHNVVIWGNHSSTQYPDVNYGYVNEEGKHKSVYDAIGDEKWLQSDFISTVQKRGAAIIEARKLSSAASAAKAIVDHMHDWVFGTPKDEVVSMAVVSDKNPYEVKEGLIYSFPVTCSGGEYHIVSGLKVDEFSRSKLTATEQELVEERETAFEILGISK